jgi:predicted transcriptional regulator
MAHSHGASWHLALVGVTLAHSLGRNEPRFAIGFGCEIMIARSLVYAKRLDFNALDPMPIGIDCRLRDRPACPPVGDLQ